MDVDLRPATNADAPAATLLLRELGYDDEAEAVRRRIERMSTTPASAVYVAESEGQVVGLVGIHAIPLLHRDGAVGRVVTLVVSPDHRRVGIGSALMLACERWAEDAGCERLEVTTSTDRPVAHAFYESFGMAPASSRFIKWL